MISVLILTVSGIDSANAECRIRTNNPQLRVVNNDALSILLTQAPRCPRDVGEFKSLLQLAGLQTEPYLVNNRGFHSRRGSYSVFESVFGDTQNLPFPLIGGQFFFGHFVLPNEQGQLDWNQVPGEGALMIELIVWDYTKGYYNFYELIGDGQKGVWFYRGDSQDIYNDNQWLHRMPSPVNFGKRLRCSGCHTSGGPILKEFGRPFNDWWTVNRPLPIGSEAPLTQRLRNNLSRVVDTAFFAANVRDGIMALENSAGYQQLKRSLTFQEILRPLFCPVEINLLSDIIPHELGSPAINIPSSHFVDTRLAKLDMVVSRDLYESALAALNSRFPETNKSDSDHAWLTPVKSFQDRQAVASLIRMGFISEELAADVLAVDMTNPNFSIFRCELLNAVPEIPSSDWVNIFIGNLMNSGFPAARVMVDHLTNPEKNLEFHRNRALNFLKTCALNLNNPEGVNEQVLLLGQRRLELARSQISQNPLGQILEPGFRVIFPSQNLDTGGVYYINDMNCRLQPF